MRTVLAIAFVLILGSDIAAHASLTRVIVMHMRIVDLDRPGALEALKHDKPAHYAKVAEAMDRVQEVPHEASPRQPLFDPGAPDFTRRSIRTSFPAKTTIAVPVDGTLYQVTVRYVKHPAKLEPAR